MRTILAVTVTAALLATVAGCDNTKPVKPKEAASAQASPSSVGLRTTPPPWPVPGDAAKYIDAAGLPALQSEGTIVHYHAHLDVIVDGKPVTVPAGIGIVVEGGRETAISPLHTHQTDGVLHIEANENAKFTLGQVFTEWDVRLSESCIGGLCKDDSHDLQFAVDGVPYAGNPLDIVLQAHQEIAILYGEKGKIPKPPASYDFAPGL